MRNKLEERAKINGLKVVMLSLLTAEAMDTIKGTTLFRHNVKKSGNNFIKSIEPYIKQSDAVYDENPEVATNLYRETEELIEALAKLNMVDYYVINKMYKEYKDNPEKWRLKYDDALIKLD